MHASVPHDRYAIQARLVEGGVPEWKEVIPGADSLANQFPMVHGGAAGVNRCGNGQHGKNQMNADEFEPAPSAGKGRLHSDPYCICTMQFIKSTGPRVHGLCTQAFGRQFACQRAAFGIPHMRGLEPSEPASGGGVGVTSGGRCSHVVGLVEVRLTPLRVQVCVCAHERLVGARLKVSNKVSSG